MILKPKKMDTFTLHIRRESAFTAMAAVTKVIIDGGTVTNLRSGGSHDVVLSRKPVNVVLLNPVQAGIEFLSRNLHTPERKTAFPSLQTDP